VTARAINVMCAQMDMPQKRIILIVLTVHLARLVIIPGENPKRNLEINVTFVPLKSRIMRQRNV
jgi:hypothetical protein